VALQGVEVGFPEPPCSPWPRGAPAAPASRGAGELSRGGPDFDRSSYISRVFPVDSRSYETLSGVCPRTWIPPSALTGNTTGAIPLHMCLRESTQRRVGGDRITTCSSPRASGTRRRSGPIPHPLQLRPRRRSQVRERLRILAGASAPGRARGDRRRAPDWTLRDAWPYGDLYVLEQLWPGSGCRPPDRARQDTPHRTLPWSGPASPWWPTVPGPAPSSTASSSGPGGCPGHGADALELHTSTGPWTSSRPTRPPWSRRSSSKWRTCSPVMWSSSSTTRPPPLRDRRRGGGRDRGCHAARQRLGGSAAYPALRQRGKAKKKRSDVPQVIVAWP